MYAIGRRKLFSKRRHKEKKRSRVSEEFKDELTLFIMFGVVPVLCLVILALSIGAKLK